MGFQAFSIVLFPGNQAVTYFHAMSTSDIKTAGDPQFENEAEWIVDITTQADRQGK